MVARLKLPANRDRVGSPGHPTTPEDPTMKKPRRSLRIAALSYLVAQAVSAHAALDGPSIVAKALQAHGASRDVKSLGALSFKLAGKVTLPEQSYSTDKGDALPFEVSVSLDFAPGSSVVDYQLLFPGGYKIDTRELIADREQRVIDKKTGLVHVGEDLFYTGSAYRYHPVMVLRALDRGAIRHLRDESSPLGEVHLLAVDGGSIPASTTILIDKASGLVRGLRFPRPEAGAPAALAEIRYSEYATVNGVKVPLTFERVPRDGGTSTMRGAYATTSFDVTAISTSIQAERDRKLKRIPAFSGGPYVRDLGDEVYLVERLGSDEYNGLVVIGKDYVAAFDAPVDVATSHEYKAIIAKLSGGRPLTHLILTHHHGDHIGGLAAFVQGDGANPPPRLVVPEGMWPFAEQLLAKVGARRFEVELVSVGKPVTFLLKDGTPLRLHNLDDNPHSAQILIAYFEGRSMLFQADLFTNHVVQEANTPANEGGVALAAAMRRLGLRPQVVLGSHGTVAGIYDFERALRMAAPQ